MKPFINYVGHSMVIEKRKKIMLVLPHAANGGMPKVASTLALEMCKNSQVVVVLLISDLDVNFDFGMPPIKLVPLGKSLFGKFLAALQRFWRLKNVIAMQQPDLILTFGVTANSLSLLAAGKTPVVITEHNIKSLENVGFVGFLNGLMMKLLYKKSNKIIALTKVMADDLIKNFGIPSEKISIIPNPHKIDVLVEKAKQPLPPEYVEFFTKNHVVISVGNTNKAKAQHHLIRIMPELIKINHKIKLVILGSPAEHHDKLVQLVKSMNLVEQVMFVGFTKNPFPFIAHAKVLALCSEREGLPNVLIESLAVGTPIVSSDCFSGPREIIAPELEDKKKITGVTIGSNGILTPNILTPVDIDMSELSFEEKELCRGILMLFKQIEENSDLTKAGYQVALEYDVSKILKKYQHIFNENQK